MNCSDISTLAPLYLTGELESDRSQAFSDHLRNCTACRRKLGEDVEFDELLRTCVIAEHVDTSYVDRRVREKLGASRRSSRRMFLAAAIAAVLLVSIIGFRALFLPGVRPVYAAAARDHRLEIVDRQTRKWVTDRASIEGLAGHEGLSGYVVEALAPAGYHLAQGKLCRLDGRLFLHLVYANDAGNFSLFLRPENVSPRDMEQQIRASTFAAQHVAGFHRGQFSALIVTEQSGPMVLNLAKFAASVL
jgi:anti-sigma factor RsiW